MAEQRDFIRELYGTSPAGAAGAAGAAGGGYIPQAPGGVDLGGGSGFGAGRGVPISPNMYGLDPMIFSQFMMG